MPQRPDVETVEYRDGRRVSVHGSASNSVVLAWHGRGAREREVLATLAEALAHAGHQVLVPDWDASAPDGGRGDLLASLEFARPRLDGAAFTLVGWSLGGTAAVGIALGTTPIDGVPTAVVALAPDLRARDRLGGPRPLDIELVDIRPRSTLSIVHGKHDLVVPIDPGREEAARWARAGVPCSFDEVWTDHAGVIGTQYDRELGRCVPADTPFTRDGLAAAVRAVGRVTRSGTDPRRPRA